MLWSISFARASRKRSEDPITHLSTPCTNRFYDRGQRTWIQSRNQEMAHREHASANNLHLHTLESAARKEMHERIRSKSMKIFWTWVNGKQKWHDSVRHTPRLEHAMRLAHELLRFEHMLEYIHEYCAVILLVLEWKWSLKISEYVWSSLGVEIHCFYGECSCKKRVIRITAFTAQINHSTCQREATQRVMCFGSKNTWHSRFVCNPCVFLHPWLSYPSDQ